MKKLIFSIFVFGFCKLSSQNVCESSRGNQNDLNVISTNKCLIPSKSSEDSRSVSVTRLKRYLTVRNVKSYGVTSVGNKLIKGNESVLPLINNGESHKNRVYSFLEVDNLPLFKMCKKETIKTSQKTCYNTEIKKYIYSSLYKSEEVMINYDTGFFDINFDINEKGKVDNIKVTGSNSLNNIKSTVKRIIHKLPRFVPANRGGKAVPASYKFKINIGF